MARFILSSFADEAQADLKEQMSISTKNSIRFIEMRNVNGTSISDISMPQIKVIKNELIASGLKISAIGSPFGKILITENFKPHLEKFIRCVEIANELETKYIRMFSFFIPEGENSAIYRDEVMERLDRFVEACKGTDVVCCHENEKGIFGNSPERCLDILKTFKGKINGIFDPANFIQESFEPLPAYKLLEPYIEYLHIKDALLSDGSVVPAGKGDGSILEILELFAEKEGDRFLTIEPHLALFDGFKALERNEISMKKFIYSSAQEAYEVAVNALKTILQNLKFSEETLSGGYCIWKR